MTDPDRPDRTLPVTLRVNGRPVTVHVESRRTLADVLRDDLDLTGTHLGCEHGACGACTVLLDGDAVRSCLLFAVQAAGSSVETVEGVAPNPQELHPVQEALRAEHGLQCGFCTPGFVMTLRALADRRPVPDDEALAEALSGVLCRCTGYQGVLRAARTVLGGERS